MYINVQVTSEHPDISEVCLDLLSHVISMREDIIPSPSEVWMPAGIAKKLGTEVTQPADSSS